MKCWPFNVPLSCNTHMLITTPWAFVLIKQLKVEKNEKFKPIDIITKYCFIYLSEICTKVDTRTKQFLAWQVQSREVQN